MSTILNRLREVADNPKDPALDVLSVPTLCKQDFARNLRILLKYLTPKAKADQDHRQL